MPVVRLRVLAGLMAVSGLGVLAHGPAAAGPGSVSGPAPVSGTAAGPARAAGAAPDPDPSAAGLPGPACAALPGPAQAAAGAARPAGTRRFDIPAQSLHDALQQYSRATGRSVLYDTRAVAGRRSCPVRGDYTPDEVLGRLLAGSGMAAHFASRDAFMLAPLAAHGEGSRAGPAGPGQALHRFYGRLQAGVAQALCGDARIAPGGYRLALRLRIDAAGRIGQVQAAARGRPELEPRIAARLAGLDVGMVPPAGLVQPVTLLVRPRAQGGAPGCAP